MNIFDIVCKIIYYLPTKDKLRLLSISKFHYSIINVICFDESVYLEKIIDLSYFNNFSNVIVTQNINIDILPNRVTQHSAVRVLGEHFNKQIKNIIPNSVTQRSAVRVRVSRTT